MRLLKWILIGLFALIVAVLVAGYVALSSYPVEDLKALIETQTEKATGRKLEIAGDVKMEISLSPAIVMEEVTLANAPWAAKRPLAHVKRLELQLALLPLLSDEIAIERLALIEPSLDLERNAEGQGNWQFAAVEKGGLSQDDTLPSFKEIAVQKAKVRLHLAPHRAAREIELESLNAGAGGLDEAVSGDMKGRLDREAFELFFQLGSMRQMLVEDRFPFFLQGNVGDSDLKLDGTTEGRDGVRFSLSVKAKSLENLSPLLGKTLPPVGPLALDVKVEAGPKTVSLKDLSATLAESDLSGELTLTGGESRPKLSGRLTAKRLEPGQVLVGPWELAPQRAQLVPDVALPVALLDLADASLDLEVTELRLPEGGWLEGLKTKLELEDRKLTLAPLAFTDAGGRFDGTVTLDREQTPTKVEVKGKVEGMDYGKALGLPLSGHLDVNLDLKGEGETLRSVVSSMRGRTRAVSSDTVVHESFLAFMGSGLTGIFSPLFGGSNSLTLTCVVSDLIWYGGTGRSEATALAGDAFVSTISGKVDILREDLDLYVDTKGRGVSLSDLVVPVRVTGSISDPTILPDPAGTVMGAAEVAGMVFFPPLLAGDLLNVELRKLNDPKEACIAAVKSIESSGGMASLVARWTQKGGDAATGLLEGAAGTAESVGEAVGEGVGEAGSAVGRGVKDAVKGVESLFGN